MSEPLCMICGEAIRDGERVFVGFVTNLKAIPSKIAFAVEKPEVEDIVVINHSKCEGIAE